MVAGHDGADAETLYAEGVPEIIEEVDEWERETASDVGLDGTYYAVNSEDVGVFSELKGLAGTAVEGGWNGLLWVC